MSSINETAFALTEHECWNLLHSHALGRLVTVTNGSAEIFPVNYVVQRHTLLFRTAEGTKLCGTVINANVLFEVDEHTVAQGWSVIVRGQAHRLDTAGEIDEAERAQLLPWTATTKLHYVRVTPTHISGRRFAFGPEPENFSGLG